MNATTKPSLLAIAQETLKEQIKDIQRQLAELQESSEVEEKSSAGDKFETHQEMLHQTRDILEKRLASSRTMLSQLNAVPIKQLETIQEGTLFEVAMGRIWVSIPMGKVVMDGQDYQLVSKDSPLVSALWEMKKGQKADFRGRAIEIKELV